MGAGDEFDDDIAPLPPHERDWRHPAELHHEARLRHSVESAPPPVGRRFAMVMGMVSLAVSFSLLLVTVPKGLSSTSAEIPAPATTSPATVKGGAGVEDTRPRAFPVANGLLVMDARHATAGRQRVALPDGRTVSATHVVTFGEHCMTVLRTDAPVSGTEWSDLDSEEFSYLGTERKLYVVDSAARRHGTRMGLATGRSDGWWPLDTDGVLDGPGAVVTADGETVGYAMRCTHETWAIRFADLVQLVSDGRGARP